MKHLVFTLLLMAAAVQGYSRSAAQEAESNRMMELAVAPQLTILEDCRITLRASVGFLTVEISVTASTCGGAYREAVAALREAVDAAREAIR